VTGRFEALEDRQPSGFEGTLLEPAGHLELRTEGEHRELIGRLVPYGVTIPAGGHRERFEPGAFADAVAHPRRVRLYLEHPPSARSRPGDPAAVGRPVPVGAAVEVTERADGLYGRFRVAATAAGDELLELVRSGILTDLSIGYAPMPGGARRGADGAEVITAAYLDHAAVTAVGAYPDAVVLAVRTALPESDSTDGRPTMPEPTAAAILEPAVTDPPTPPDPPAPDDPDTPDLPELRHRMGTLEDTVRRYIAGSAPAPSAPVLSPLDWFRAEIRALHQRDPSQRLNLRALADVTGELGGTGDMSGFVVEHLLGEQLVSVLDTRRPLFASLGPISMPASGFVRIPTITQHVLVAKRTGQKDPANSRAMVTTTAPFEAQWFDGAVDVALEWIATAEPAGIELVWDDLLSSYAEATEAYAAEVLGAAGVAVGVLPVADFEAFATAIATQSIEVRKATGQPADYLAVPDALWPAVIALSDSTGRRMFAPVGPSNAEGPGAGVTAAELTMSGGFRIFNSAGLTNPILSNARAAVGVDGGPSRVEAYNVELMGRDIGIIGRSLVVARIPAGIREFVAPAGRARSSE